MLASNIVKCQLRLLITVQVRVFSVFHEENTIPFSQILLHFAVRSHCTLRNSYGHQSVYCRCTEHIHTVHTVQSTQLREYSYMSHLKNNEFVRIFLLSVQSSMKFWLPTFSTMLILIKLFHGVRWTLKSGGGGRNR